MLPVSLLLLQIVSYSNDIAPVLAFHCNKCHGDEGIAADADTRTYRSLRETTNLALMMELMEGRRGESRRMPKESPALDAATLDKFRSWIAAGAPEDQETSPPQVIRRMVGTKPELLLHVDVAGAAYVAIELRDDTGRVLHRQAGVVQTSREWKVKSASHWPASMTIVMTARYATGPVRLRLDD